MTNQIEIQGVMIDGLDRTNVCVGDRFSSGKLVLEVSSPRRPCANVDNKHGRRYNQKCPRAHTAREGLAGWFCRVIVPGELAAGDTLRLTHRPYPEWTLQHISNMVYSNATNARYDISSWPGTKEELVKLTNHMPELALYEWRIVLQDILRQVNAGELRVDGDPLISPGVGLCIGVVVCTLAAMFAQHV